jgi:hypothetical protein
MRSQLTPSGRGKPEEATAPLRVTNPARIRREAGAAYLAAPALCIGSGFKELWRWSIFQSPFS